MIDLQSPTRQSKLSMLLYLAKKLRALLFMAIFLIGSWGNFMGSTYMYYGVLAFGVITLISPVIDWYYFVFYRQQDKLIIEKGLLNKKRQEIPMDRIQNINITQSVIQRLLGLASLEVDTAGSAEKEFEIIGLEKPKAYRLKELLDPENVDHESEISMEQDHETIVLSSKTLLVSLSPVELLKVGLTQNHLKSGFVALGLVIGFWYKIKDVVEWFYADALDVNVGDLVKGATVGLVIGTLIAFIISSILVSIVSVFVKFYDFKAELHRNNLEISMGLLTRKEFKIPLSKIQIITFHANPLRDILGYQTAKIYQVISKENNSKSTNRSLSVPACLPRQQHLLLEKIFGDQLSSKAAQVRPSVKSYVLITIYFLAIPSIALAILGYLFLPLPWIWSIIAAVVLLVGGMLAWRYATNCVLSIDRQFLQMKKGWIFRSTMMTPYYRAQAVGYLQSIFLRRRGVAHFEIHTAAGKRMMRYIRLPELEKIADRVNNTVIFSQKEWM